MSLIKVAIEKEKEGGIVGWTKRHPLLAGGIALTGGIAASDAVADLAEHHFGEGIKAGFKSLKDKGIKKVVKESMPVAKKGLAKGILYGATLAAVEPLILHGGLKKEVE